MKRFVLTTPKGDVYIGPARVLDSKGKARGTVFAFLGQRSGGQEDSPVRRIVRFPDLGSVDTLLSGLGIRIARMALSRREEPQTPVTGTTSSLQEIFVPREDPELTHLVFDCRRLNTPVSDLALHMLRTRADEQSGPVAIVAKRLANAFGEDFFTGDRADAAIRASIGTKLILAIDSPEEIDAVLVNALSENDLSVVSRTLELLGEPETFRVVGEIRPAVFAELFNLFEKLAGSHAPFDHEVARIISELPPTLYLTVDDFLVRLAALLPEAEDIRTLRLIPKILNRYLLTIKGETVPSRNDETVFSNAAKEVLDQSREVIERAIESPGEGILVAPPGF